MSLSSVVQRACTNGKRRAWVIGTAVVIGAVLAVPLGERPASSTQSDAELIALANLVERTENARAARLLQEREAITAQVVAAQVSEAHKRAQELAAREAAARAAQQRASRSATRSTTTKSTTKKSTGTKSTGVVRSGDIEAVISYALAQVGKPYVYGTAGPNTYDCSGLVKASFARAGIKLPHSSYSLLNYGRKVSKSELRRGDIVWPQYGHVGIYLGNGKMVHAANPRQGVIVSSVYAFTTARRIIG